MHILLWLFVEFQWCWGVIFSRGSDKPSAFYWCSSTRSGWSNLSPSLLRNSDNTKNCIQRHLVDLIRYYPQLIVDVNNDLILVRGYIPYSFCGNIYGAPVMIWLLESYPVTRPRVVLNCPNSHYICEKLVNVTRGGLINVSYLQNWVSLGSRANLVALVSHLSAKFTCQPPLGERWILPWSRFGAASNFSDFRNTIEYIFCCFFSLLFCMNNH